MAGKRQKLEVIRRPQIFKVEEEEHVAVLPVDEAQIVVEDDAAALCIIPQEGQEEEEEEQDGPNEKLHEQEEEDGDLYSELHPKASFVTPSATLVAAPVYPNAVKWSDDNLLAVATSQLITILNPALMDGPRGFVTASSGQAFVVGTVQQTDVDAPCLLPIRLSKDVRAVVRSMDWSPQGLAPNGGCLLIVCTRDHRVKLYRAPHSEYQCEWIQVCDVSEIVYEYHLESGCTVTNQGDIRLGAAGTCDQFDLVHGTIQSTAEGATSKGFAMVPSGSSLSTGVQPRSVMDSKNFLRFTNVLAYVSVAWSPAMRHESLPSGSQKKINLTMALLALGAKSGEVTILKCIQPADYSLEKVTLTPLVSLVTIIKAHEAWVSALTWSKLCQAMHNEDTNGTTCAEEILLATGSSDGSVKLWVGEVGCFTGATTSSNPLTLLKKVVLEDLAPVASVALGVSLRSGLIQVAVGKTSGSIAVIEARREENSQQEALKFDGHSQAVTGLVWAFDGRCLYSCSQDNSLRAWNPNGGNLLALPFPDESTRKTKRSVFLPDSVLDGYYGLCLSKGSLALATLRGVSTELLDQMYESRAVKAMAQVFWVGGQQFDALSSVNSLVPIHGSKIGNLETNCIQWESNLLAALHYLENKSQKVALWDITACFTSLASIMGKDYVNTLVFRWISSFGLLYSDSEDGSITSMRSCKESISNASCRRLQTVFAILKRLYLMEDHDPLTILDKMSLENAAESFFESLESSWRSFALDVEHELRERLVHLTVSSALLSLENCSATSTDDQFVDISGVTCMLQWVAVNSSRVSQQLSNDAQILAQILRGRAKAEACSVCKAMVPFASVETGICEGGHPHKLPRCLVTFKLCPPGSHWFCYCCARWASKQAPRIFFTTSSRWSLIELDSLALIKDVEPTCPYCGILMQRYFPDCFLRFSLV